MDGEGLAFFSTWHNTFQVHTGCTSFLFMAEQLSLCVDTILFIHSTINGHLCCFHFGAIVNRATVNNVILPWHYVERLVLQNTNSCYTQSNLLFKLRWNLHNIKLTILKQTIQWHLVYSQYCITIASLQFQDISMTPKENPNPTAVTAIWPFPQPLAATTLLSVSTIYLFQAFCVNGTSQYVAF